MSCPPPPVFDAEPHAETVWDEADAAALVGQLVLIGVTWREAHDGPIVAQGQYHGRVVVADAAIGIEIACEGSWAGHRLLLPPALEFFDPAPPGTYELAATPDTVVDPDFLARVTIVAPPHH